jgi:NapC/NirT cytochrome c family, N-terminal region
MRSFFIALTRNPISLAGSAITTASVVVFLTLFAIDIVGQVDSPYMGILAYLVVPAFFALGLLIIPLGIALERRAARWADGAGGAPPAFPVIDLNHARTRTMALVFFAFTSANVVLLATATYKGVEVMEGTAFCGRTCHTVMQPEYTAYQRSPHANVKCVSCHIGPGGSWFVRSKLTGTWQVLAVAFNLYPRPIPAPVPHLRAARETCEECHSPSRFTGDRLKVLAHYDDDETVSPRTTVLMMKVGGTRGAVALGIHWHASPGVRIRYRSDERRETIGDVELTLPGGTVKTFRPKSAAEGGKPIAGPWREMDCVDCHNRAGHRYRTPDREVDEAIDSGRIDRALPFARREALAALGGTYASQREARSGVAAAFAGFYRKSYPDVAGARLARIVEAGRALGDIYCGNVFPAMSVTWGAYPDHLGHMDSPGCFRCHDENHATGDGEIIPQDCGTCHDLLATEEKEPAVLKALRP